MAFMEMYLGLLLRVLFGAAVPVVSRRVTNPTTYALLLYISEPQLVRPT